MEEKERQVYNARGNENGAPKIFFTHSFSGYFAFCTLLSKTNLMLTLVPRLAKCPLHTFLYIHILSNLFYIVQQLGYINPDPL